MRLVNAVIAYPIPIIPAQIHSLTHSHAKFTGLKSDVCIDAKVFQVNTYIKN